MKNLRRVVAATVLTLLLIVPAFAGEVLTPPCNAGEVLTPPCSAAPGDISTPGVDSTAPADLSTVANSETSFADFAADLLLNLLPLY